MEIILIILFLVLVFGTLFALPMPFGVLGILFWLAVLWIVWQVLQKNNQV
jgi:hypothetical protein